MTIPTRVADMLVEELNSRLVPDEETAAFYKLKHGHVPKLANHLISDQDFFDNSYPSHSYNAMSFDPTEETIPGLLAEAWHMLTTVFSGAYYPSVYMVGLGRVAILLRDDVIFFMYGLEIVYIPRNRVTYTVIEDNGLI